MGDFHGKASVLAGNLRFLAEGDSCISMRLEADLWG